MASDLVGLSAMPFSQNHRLQWAFYLVRSRLCYSVASVCLSVCT